MRRLKLGLGLVFVGALAACSSGSPTVAVRPTGPAPQLTPVIGDGRMEVALNGERIWRGLRPVVEDAALVRAAAAHARDMSARAYFAHVSPDGGTPMDRMRAAGGCRAAVAENIATGQADDGEVFQGWLGSPGHQRNMMGPHYTRYGVASHQGYYVMVLAGPCV